MATITDINIGAAANDGTGTTARAAGTIINDNFDNLNNDKLESSEYTAADVKTKYESNADTNAFTDADETKLDGIEAGAEVNTIDSDPTGVTGADQVTNVMSLTTAEYGAITPDSSTLYIITDA